MTAPYQRPTLPARPFKKSAMAKHGQAKVLNNDEFDALLQEIEKHRHPEKNALIMKLSYRLGLRVQEIALLCMLEVVGSAASIPPATYGSLKPLMIVCEIRI